MFRQNGSVNVVTFIIHRIVPVNINKIFVYIILLITYFYLLKRKKEIEMEKRDTTEMLTGEEMDITILVRANKQFKSDICFILISYGYIESHQCQTVTFKINIDETDYELKYIFTGDVDDPDNEMVVSEFETKTVIDAVSKPFEYIHIVGLFILHLTPKSVDEDMNTNEVDKIKKNVEDELLKLFHIDWRRFHVSQLVIVPQKPEESPCVVMGGKTKRKSKKRMMKRKSKKRMMKRKSKRFFRR